MNRLILLCVLLLASCAIPAKQVVTVDNRVGNRSQMLSFPIEREGPLVWDIAFSADGKKLLIAQMNNLTEWTLDEHPTKRTLLRVAGTLFRLKLSHDGTTVAVSENSSVITGEGVDTIYLLDYATGQRIREIRPGSGRYPHSMAFSADDSLFAWSELPGAVAKTTKTYSADGTVSSTYTNVTLGAGEARLMVMSLKTGETASDSVSMGSNVQGDQVSISRAQDRVSWFGYSWKLEQSRKLALTHKRTYRFPLQAYSPDGQRGYGMAPLYLHDIGTYKRLSNVPFPEALYQIDLASAEVAVRRQWRDAKGTMYTFSMDVSPDGRLLAIGTYDDGIHIIDLVANRDLGRLLVEPKKWLSFDRVTFSRDGRRIAGCMTTGAYVWDVPVGK